jgi:hypothetical protein
MLPAPTATTFTLRHLPLPARLVVTVFLLTTGLGYFSALVQLHLKHSSLNGEPLPGPGDVVAVFAGREKYDAAKHQTPVSKLESLVMGPLKGASWDGKGSMAPAFFDKSDGDYKTRIKDEQDAPKVTAEREGERLAVQAWINLPETDRKAAFESDMLPRPEAVTAITDGYAEKSFIKLRSILTDRCARCHGQDGDVPDYRLETYEHYAKYMARKPAKVADAQGYVESDRKLTIEKLTQSTHAHLLSFGMLFGLTGLVFAFTSYNRPLRVVVAPVVLVAQVADVSCWWLARLDGVGPLFAMAIMGTGAVVGLGLLVQILGSIFDMFHKTGRWVLVLLLVIAAGGFGVLYTKAIEPALQAEKQKSSS